MTNKITLKEKLVKEYKNAIHSLIERHKNKIINGCKANAIVGCYVHPTPIAKEFILKSGEIIEFADNIINYFINEEGFSKSDIIIEELDFASTQLELSIDEIEEQYGNLNDFYHPDVKDQLYYRIRLDWRP